MGAPAALVEEVPAIRIEGARTHNLKGISCHVPLGSLAVVSGVSGSGKSSLAFDTLYAEGQRRYVSSLSTYARLFLERLPRPEVDSISDLPPAIAIERRNRVTNARSTVGTATEILDHLRLVFAKIGEMVCPECEVAVESGTVEAVADRAFGRFAGARVLVGAPLDPNAAAGALREALLRDGFTRLLDADGAPLDLAEASPRRLAGLRQSGLLLLDRLALRGEVVVCDAASGERAHYREGLACDRCGRRFPPLEPALFSFNHATGACPTCEGFGRVAALDRARVVPDPGQSLEEGAVAPFRTPRGRRWQRRLLAAARDAGVATDRPVAELPAEAREWIFAGGGGWRGVEAYFRRLERKRYKVGARVLIARYRRFERCPDCGGTRLREAGRSVRVGGRALHQLTGLSLAELHAWVGALALPPAQAERVARLRVELAARLETAVAVGLGYLTLDRPTRTLSGGEAQRIQLSAALGGTLTASLYVLDEPSIGLHARDARRLVEILRAIRDRGNTVVVVEHDPVLIGAADHVIDLGPGAGRLGGALLAEGSVAELRQRPESVTGRLLAGELSLPARRRRTARGALRVIGADEHNLRDLTVSIPLGQLVVVSGVSGAGKSTLVRSVLVGGLRGDPDRGACRSIEGAEALREVVWVDPTPPARSPRSNPATVSKAFDPIRARFAATREARALGAAAGWFSFNVPGGRCEACEGAGEVVVDMQFLEDLRVPCEECGGLRFRADALSVRLDGLSIVDVLALSVDEALERFTGDAPIGRRLRPLADVGLGYLALGQPLSTLSGGETQRLRLAQALAERARGNLYVLDEPTTGLHAADVAVLVGCLDRVVAAGASVLVVEHNLEMIRAADHVIDLGPDAGPEGGQLVAEGTPEEVARSDGHTGVALRGG